MIKALSFLLAIYFLYGGSSLSAEKVTIYADANYPPYSYEENGKAKGIYADVLRLAFSRLKGYEVNIIPTAWKRGLNLLRIGEAFALYPPYRREKERPYIRPYSTSILTEEVIVVCRDDIIKSRNLINWPEDFIGLKIGFNLGYETFGIRFWKLAAKGLISAEESLDTPSNLKKVIHGRIDCYGNDRAAIYSELAKLQRTGEYNPIVHGPVEVAQILTSETAHIGYVSGYSERFHFKEDFVSKLNIIINEMKMNGEIEKIYSVHTQTD